MLYSTYQPEGTRRKQDDAESYFRLRSHTTLAVTTQMPRTHRQSVVVPGTRSIPAAPVNPHTTALVFSIFCQAIMMISSLA
jgi:hypothetical protein